jgi:hypothetical protein
MRKQPLTNIGNLIGNISLTNLTHQYLNKRNDVILSVGQQSGPIVSTTGDVDIRQ